MVSRSLTSTHSTEAWESLCDQHEPEQLVELWRMVPIESMQLGGEESPLSGLYRMPASQSSSTSSHMFYIDFEAVDMVFVEADTAGAPSGNWNPAPRLLHTAERGDDAILYLERLFDCDRPPLQTALEGLCFLHEHKIAHCASAGFDRTRLPVRYYRVDFSRAQELPREADPRSASFCRDVRDCGAMFQTLVEEVPKIGGKLRSLVLFEALCKGIDASTYDAPLQIP
ncbi:hypothetical protein EDB87DRAFT_1642534 [Lactarius vividus]|nr:hypothetical protein EDB87DRAFT_1642534 [Lactarius vividus]